MCVKCSTQKERRGRFVVKKKEDCLIVANKLIEYLFTYINFMAPNYCMTSWRLQIYAYGLRIEIHSQKSIVRYPFEHNNWCVCCLWKKYNRRKNNKTYSSTMMHLRTPSERITSAAWMKQKCMLINFSFEKIKNIFRCMRGISTAAIEKQLQWPMSLNL